MKDMGYPQVEMKQDVQDLNYNLNSKKCLVIYNKIQTTKGQSGSPIFLEFYPNNQNLIPKYQLIGVHTGSNQRENFGTYIEHLSNENLKKIFCPDDSESQNKSLEEFFKDLVET